MKRLNSELTYRDGDMNKLATLQSRADVVHVVS